MMKKDMIRWIVFVFIIALLSLSVNAESEGAYAIFYFDISEGIVLERMLVVEDDFYHEHLLYEDILGQSQYDIRFEDGEGYPWVYTNLMDYKTIVNYLDLRRVVKLKILDDEEMIYEQVLSFCNNNGVCEPCKEMGCIVAENSWTCSDCTTGSGDDYCDLIKDDICDPDCHNEDSDCAGCEPYCYYDDMPRPSFCSDFGGDICADDEICQGDALSVDTLDADGGRDCCIGDAECMPKKQHDDVPDEVFAEDYGSEVLSEDELWDLEAKERAELGMGFDEDTLNDEEQDELHNDLYEIESLDANLMTDEEWDDLLDDPSFPSDYEVPPTAIEKLVEDIEEVYEGVPDEASPLFIIFMAIIIILTLGLLVVLFMHRSEKKISREDSNSKVRKEIASLVKQGYSYEQIRSMLLNRGHDLITVNNEIMSHYRSASVQYGKKK